MILKVKIITARALGDWIFGGCVVGGSKRRYCGYALNGGFRRSYNRLVSAGEWRDTHTYTEREREREKVIVYLQEKHEKVFAMIFF
jgi:hypothetical protein